MKALILSGFNKNTPVEKLLSDFLIETLNKRNWTVEYIILRDKNIAACQGCFECWIKTPGICKIDDFGRIFVKKLVANDLIIHLTPIMFGGYSSQLKRALDRFIPILLPFFKSVDGETHHKQRYANRASIISIGYIEELDEEETYIFKQLVQRNSLNMGAPLHESLSFSANEGINGIQSELVNLLTQVEGIL